MNTDLPSKNTEQSFDAGGLFEKEDPSLFNSEQLSMDSNNIIFAPEIQKIEIENKLPGWKILIVDDEKDVHTVTRIALNRFQFQGLSIQILSAFSTIEAIDMLNKHPDIALILLDIVMETDNAGFDFLKYIRSELNNQYVRVIIRTGQPGQTPEIEVVKNYDVNDYKLKTEYTNEQLITCIKTSLRVYNGIKDLDNQRKRLENEVHLRSQELIHQSKTLETTKHKIEQATQAKASFLSSMSHELRTPMNGIIGMAQMLFDTHLSKEQLDLTKDICNSGEQLLIVINNILDYSRLESNRLTLENEMFSMKDCIQEVTQKREKYARQKGLKLIDYIDKNLPNQFLGDRVRIQQILFHLLDNAIQFTQKGGIILSLSLANMDNDHESAIGLQFSIKDTGIGIHPKIRDTIFDRFSLSMLAQSKIFGGSGLGLAICKKLAELMGGTIWIENTSNRGTTISFTILLKKVAQQRLVPDPCRVLVIADLKIDRTIMEYLLKQMGHKVDAITGDTLFETLKKNPYDIIFIDVMLPLMDDCLEIIHQIVRETSDHPKPKIIAATTSPLTDDHREKYIHAGVDDIVMKPLSKDVLVRVL
ncbi:MAG: response regulator [Candidatus Magnetomorum sp.]|nr:response regulator [Candidatus Magnetomorum sp.]